MATTQVTVLSTKKIFRDLGAPSPTSGCERTSALLHHSAELWGFLEPRPKGCHFLYPRRLHALGLPTAQHTQTKVCSVVLGLSQVGELRVREDTWAISDREEGSEEVTLNTGDQGCLWKEGCLGAEVLMKSPRTGFNWRERKWPPWEISLFLQACLSNPGQQPE